MAPSSSRTTSPPARSYRLSGPDHRQSRHSKLSVEQALADTETAAAVAALTAVQSQGFSRPEKRAYSPGHDRSRAPSVERPKMSGQHNAYRYPEQGMSSSGPGSGDADAWGQAPPYQYGSPLNSLDDMPNYSKGYPSVPEHGLSTRGSGSSTEDLGSHKKRRIDNDATHERSHQYQPNSHYQSSSRSTPQSLQRLYHDESGDAGKGNSHSYEAEDSDHSDPNDPKRRKVQRACDLCRRKKIRCDGAHSSRRNQKCSNCVEAKSDCTYVEAAKRRGPPLGYIETLEWKVSKLEALAQRLKPSIDLTGEVGPPISRDSFDLDSYKLALTSLDIPYTPPSSRSKGSRGMVSSQRNRKNGKDGQEMTEPGSSATGGTGRMPLVLESWEEVKAACQQNMQVSTMGPDMQSPVAKIPDVVWPTLDSSKTNCAPTPTKEEEKEYEDKEEAEDQKFVGQLACNNPTEGYRYLGKSSGVQFLRSAMDYKAAVAGESMTGGGDSRRLRYWALPIWEATTSQPNNQAVDLSRWPSPELSQALIDAYFEDDNITLPLLNRVFFQRDVDSGRWKKDVGFAKVCLLVFAVGSKHVDHPDVYWHAGDERAGRAAMEDMETYRHSAGWRWMEAVVKTGKSMLKPASLEELQTLTLCAVFAMRSAVFTTVCAIAGMGLKSAIDIGMHTRVGLQRCASVAEAELYKRAFWSLLTLDRMSCAGMGRTLSLRDEDFDVDYPLDVDDEYWDTGNPLTDLVQPVGKPSRISMFISSLKLGRITAFAIMNVYIVNKVARGKDAETPEHQKKLIADLDSDLYAWLDSVPAHLRWDPERKDPIFFQQSAVLYANYYNLQILIHRPFIPTSRTAPSIAALALPSLAICTNAARACARIINSSCQRNLIQHHLANPAFTAAIVLLMGVWGGNKLGVGSAGDKTSTLEDVRSCLRCLKMSETWWRGAGRMRDILMELANWSDTYIDTPTPGPNTDQQRGQIARGYRTEPSSQTSSPRASTGNYGTTQTRSDFGSDFSSAHGPALAPKRHLSQPPISMAGYASETNRVPENVQLPWWFVSRESGVQGLEGAVSHPMMPSNQNMAGGDYLPDMFGGMPTPQNSFGQVPLGPTASQAMQGNAYGSIPAFELGMPGSANPGYGRSNNMPPPTTTGTTSAPNVSNDFWSMQDPNAMEMSGVLADIWSMAPSTFEMDQWSLYLSQPQPAEVTTDLPQGFMPEPFFG